MDYLVLAHWVCHECDVEGRDELVDGSDPACWNCGGEVIVTARPSIPLGDPFEGLDELGRSA